MGEGYREIPTAGGFCGVGDGADGFKVEADDFNFPGMGEDVVIGVEEAEGGGSEGLVNWKAEH